MRDLRSDQADTLLASIGTHEDPDCDYDFFTEAQSQNYHRECQRLIQQMWKELGQVYHQTKLFPKSCQKLDLLEIMCSDDSVLTDQVNQLGGSAKRFGLSEGDLKQSCHRKKLFETLVRQKPEHVWFSPECAPWCMWSFLNCTKNIHTGVKIMENRWQNLWQLSLAVVLYRFQMSNNAQFSLEQPCGSLMLKVPRMDEIVHNLSWCQFDMCRVGSLVHPETSEPIRKRMIVCTSSRALHQSLHGKLCNQEHKHRLIQGQVLLRGERIRLSTFTEKYPIKFGRQIAKLILKEKAWDNPIYANEADSHPTKRRRLSKKANSVEIEQMFPCVNWQTALHIADRTAPRVGIQIIDTGHLFQSVQKLCPNHDIHHLVVSRGTDRLVGPSCQIAKGKAPVRKRGCIRRRFEDIHVEDEWEPWEKLSVKALRRGGVAARVSVTIFASPKLVVGTQSVQPSADAPIHESPAESASEAKRRRVETDESGDPLNSHRSVADSPIDDKERGTPKVEEDPSVDQSSREFIDWTSQKHGPKFLQLSKETQHWIVKLHRNLGHPGAMKLKLFCKQVGCPNNVIEAIDHLKCSTCEESKGPTIARPSAIHSEGDFGDCISMDGITWTNSQGERFHFYHFVDHSTAFQTAICSPSRSTEAAVQAVTQGWISWAGAPGVICLDAATELKAEEFGVFAQKHNICVRTIATDAHWQNSRAERHGGILQEMLKRMDLEEPIKDYDHLATALSFATSTKNQRSRYRGFAPEILVFGKHRKIAGSISSDLTMSAHSLALSETPEGIRFRKELSI